MRLYDLGPLRVEVGGQSVALKGRMAAALTTLLLHRDRRVSIDLLSDAIWGDATSARSNSTLETHIWRLRRLIEPDRAPGQPSTVLVNDSGGYRLTVTIGQVDSARFQQLSLDVLDLLTTEQSERALQAADDALQLWRGDPYLAIAERSWASGSITALTETRTQLREWRIDALLGAGHPELAVTDLSPLLTEHPLRERLWWQRMVALYRTGRTDEALQTFHSLRQTLLSELGIEPGQHLVELQRRILQHDPELRSPPRRQKVPSRSVEIRLPHQRPILGRETDLRAVGELLHTHQLVTVAGAAGIGKTSLAVEAARRQAPSFPDGLWFIDLTAADPCSELTNLVAAALGLRVPEERTGALAVLSDYVVDRQALLVLDNCEHVLDQVADLIETLDERRRQATFIATSREPLGLPAEAIFTLAPLRISPENHGRRALSAEEPAAALFVERARLPIASLTEDSPDLVHVRRICRAVDGLPLAIELAAALTSVYSLAEVTDQVERDPGQLAAIGRGQARHHQTIASAIERSHQLLSGPEQVLHRRLAVVPGPFRRELAAALVGTELGPQADGHLARLARCSLLTVSRSDDTTRFAQLAPIRSHAFHALRATQEVELAEQLLDNWVATLVAARPRAGRAEAAQWQVTVTQDLPALRATLHRRLVAAPDLTGRAITGQLMAFWYYADLLEEGTAWTEAALRQAPDPDFGGLTARLTLTGLMAMRSRAGPSTTLLAESLTMVDADRSGFRLRHVDTPLTQQQQIQLAELLIAVATAFSVVRDAKVMQRCLDLVRTTPVLADDIDLALAHEAARCLQEVVHEDTNSVLDHAEATFHRAEAQGNLWAAWISAASAASVALTRRDPLLGQAWSRRVIDHQGRLGAHTMMAQVETMGDFLALDDRLVEAVRIFAATHHQARQVGHPWPRNPLTTELLAQCRARLTARVFNAAWAAGPTIARHELLD